MVVVAVVVIVAVLIEVSLHRVLWLVHALDTMCEELLAGVLCLHTRALILEHVWQGAACEGVRPGVQQAWGIRMIILYTQIHLTPHDWSIAFIQFQKTLGTYFIHTVTMLSFSWVWGMVLQELVA